MAAPWVSLAEAGEGVHPVVEAAIRAGRIEAALAVLQGGGVVVTHISRVKTVSYSINPGSWCPAVLFFAFPTVYIGHLSRCMRKSGSSVFLPAGFQSLLSPGE